MSIIYTILGSSLITCGFSLFVHSSPVVEPSEVEIYNPVTKGILELPFVEYAVDRNPKHLLKRKDDSQEEAGEQRGPCFCRNETVGPMCGCCFGMKIDRFNFSQESNFSLL